MKRLFKKNQIIIYTIALMLVVAGYLNYTTNNDSINSAMQTSSSEEELTQMANIGDAQLVSSNAVDENNNTSDNNVVENTISTQNIVSNDTVKTSTTNVKNSNDYFTTSKLERDTMYSQILETYEKVLNSSNSLETQKQSATDEITKINNTKNSIMICENLIQTKGFENSIIFVNGDSISVVIRADTLSKEQVAQVQNIISREMNAKVENIHISNK